MYPIGPDFPNEAFWLLFVICKLPFTRRSVIPSKVSVADPGFPVGGCGLIRGHGPPTLALFGENVCENERIGSHGGCAPEIFVCRSANEYDAIIMASQLQQSNCQSIV